jgi:predicted nucleotidyltransferase
MYDEIKNTLIQQCKTHNVTILYACESGSRAWGFPSPDSDYDVRFIYVHKRDWYLSLFDERDVIEQPINDLLDISGWDLRKALLLLYNSNAALIEWLHSPITYMQNNEMLNSLQNLAAISFQPLGVCHHYLGMANKGWDAVSGQKYVKLKRYFYILRALLCCEWIINEKSIPPVQFQNILEKYYPTGEFRDVIEQLLLMKLHSNESDKIYRQDYITLFDVVDNRIKELFTITPEHLPSNTEKVDKSIFDNTFRTILKNLEPIENK